MPNEKKTKKPTSKTKVYYHLFNANYDDPPLPKPTSEFDFLHEAKEGFKNNFKSLVDNNYTEYTLYNIAEIIKWITEKKCSGNIKIVNGFYTDAFHERLVAAKHEFADEVGKRKNRIISVLEISDGTNTYAYDLGTLQP